MTEQNSCVIKQVIDNHKKMLMCQNTCPECEYSMAKPEVKQELERMPIGKVGTVLLSQVKQEKESSYTMIKQGIINSRFGDDLVDIVNEIVTELEPLLIKQGKQEGYRLGLEKAKAIVEKIGAEHTKKMIGVPHTYDYALALQDSLLELEKAIEEER